MPDEQNEITMRSTGIHELDRILQGGFPTGAAVLLAGASGTGKTILATQWLFAGYDQFNEPGLFISLTEPVVKALNNARKMSFFKEEFISPVQIHFTDLRGIMKGLDLENKEFTRRDIDTVVGVLDNMVRQSQAKRVVIDSVTAMAYRLKERDLIRDFIFRLGTLFAQSDANVLMTSEVVAEGYSVYGVEEFIADGILKLSHRTMREELVRQLEVVKMRGTDYDPHPATFRISGNGMRLFPRLSRELAYHVSNSRLSTGIEGLDSMTGGGYFAGSSVLITGSSGTGKTIMALQFLVDGVKKGEKVVLVSFEESRDQLFRNARSFGWDLEAYEQQGLLHIITSYPEHRYLEEHIEMIRATVEEADGPKRLVIDSLSSLGNVFSEEILRDFVSRLNGFLKEKLITTLFTNATSTLLGATQITDSHLSTITDHIIMIRYVEIQSELHHAVLILKMRGSAHDKKLRELIFTPAGLRITSEFKGLEGVLKGTTRRVSASVQEQLHSLFLEFMGPMGDTIFAQEREKGLTLESVSRMIEELGDQGIISKRRKEEFVDRTKRIF